MAGVSTNDICIALESTLEPIKSVEEKWKLVPSFLRTRGLIKQHIASYDHFIKHDIKKIVRENNSISSCEDPNFYLKYLDIHVGKPEIVKELNCSRRITPQECRLRDMTYSAPITVDVEYVRGQEVIVQKGIEMGKMPIMLRSSNCTLDGISPAEMTRKNECPYDCGGYFIIRGTEKVILIQEQISQNGMKIAEDIKGNRSCQMLSNAPKATIRTDVVLIGGKYYLRQDSFLVDIPIAIVFKAMGFVSDQEIFQMVGTHEDLMASVIPSVEECVNASVFTKEQALKYLGSRLRGKRHFGEEKEKAIVEDGLEIITTAILARIPVINSNFKAKAMHLALMIRKLFQANNHPTSVVDQFGDMRLELAGPLLSLLFEDLFKRMNFELKVIADKSFRKVKAAPLDFVQAAPFDVVKHMRQNLITSGIENAMFTGNWTIKRFRMDRQGVTHTLSRLSYISGLGMMTRIHSQFEKTRDVSWPHSLKLSQWGMICPTDTPQGKESHVYKNLALMTHVTTEAAEEPIVKIVQNMGVEDINLFSGEEMSDPYVYAVFVNGILIGLVEDHQRLIRWFKLTRRKGHINAFVSISAHLQTRSIYISSDGGRLCRPYIIVQKGKSAVTDKHLKELADNFRNFDDFIHEGLIEFLDVNEENDSSIAVYESDINQESTHLEIEPFTLLGVCAGLIPYPHHNHSLRNTYQCAMGRQAMGTVACNQRIRMDPSLYNLVHPQRPMVKTRTSELISLENLPAGENAIVAVMSNSGFDGQKAMIFNKASLDRGYGRCAVYKTSKCVLKKHDDQRSDCLKTTYRTIWKNEHLEADGCAGVAQLVQPTQVLINKAVRKNETPSPVALGAPAAVPLPEYIDAPIILKGSGPSYVEKVMLSTNAEEFTVIKVQSRQTRRPEIGDTFSTRHGQKGIVGLVVEQEDLPFTEQGISPDIILNPHEFPSCMPVGMQIELLAGKVGLLEGKFHEGTAFGGTKIEDVSEELIKAGYNYEGQEVMISGTTGEHLTAYIYFGPVYYQKLKHMVADKVNVRSRGKTNFLTRQPTEDQGQYGGSRLGEMDRDCIIAYGASMLLVERMTLSSDAFDVDVCNQCGFMGHSGWCHYCQSSVFVSSVRIPYAFKLLLQELTAMNISPRLKLKEVC